MGMLGDEGAQPETLGSVRLEFSGEGVGCVTREVMCIVYAFILLYMGAGTLISWVWWFGGLMVCWFW